MKYIQDSQGQVHGFDSTDPAQVEIMDALFYTGGVLNTGCTDVSASWPPAPALAQAQADACAAIDGQAGVTRLKYITAVPGQADTYTQKAADAANYKAAGYPFASIASYPWVQAEAVAINGATPTAAQAQAAADGILATEAAWVTKGAAIEQQRRAGKIAVGLATTVAAVQSAQTAAIAALQLL